MQVWINSDEPKNVAAISAALETAVKANSAKEFKAFVIFMNPEKLGADAMKKALAAIGKDKKLELTALAYLVGPDDSAVKRYAINPDKKVKNTLLFYKGKQVKSKLINLLADKKGINTLDDTVKKLLE